MNGGSVRTRLKIIISGSLLCVTLSGCSSVFSGGSCSKTVAIGKDTARLDTHKDFNEAWSVTYKTLEEMGAITQYDKDAGWIEANVQKTKIAASVRETASKTVRIQIQSRQDILPGIDLSVEIINTIDQRL